MHPGVTLNPATPLNVLEYILDELDMVLLMTVNPGFESQAFIPAMLPKIETLRETIVKRGLDVDIEVDGGISTKHYRECIGRGRERICGRLRNLL